MFGTGLHHHCNTSSKCGVTVFLVMSGLKMLLMIDEKVAGPNEWLYKGRLNGCYCHNMTKLLKR